MGISLLLKKKGVMKSYLFLLTMLCFSKTTNAQVEQYEKVILTRYFKPQVTYSVMTSSEFMKPELTTKFFNYLNQPGTTSDDFRNFITLHQSKTHKELPNTAISKIPSNPMIPDRGFTSMLKTYFKFIISPILLKKMEKKKNEVRYAVNSNLKGYAEEIAKERILQIWGYNEHGSFDYNYFLNEAKKNSNDLESFIAENSSISNRAYQDIMVEMVNRNFIIVYNLRECMNFNDYYRSKNIPEYRRLKKDGITINIEAYIFKINWTKEDQQYFFENCWFDKSSLNLKNKSLEAFNKMKINVELVDIVGDEATEQYFELTDYDNMDFIEKGWKQFWNPIKYERNRKLMKNNNYNEYIQTTNQIALENVISNLHNNMRLDLDHFKLRSILSTQDRLESRIGENENLYRNDRFVAYEIHQKSNGEVKKVYKGVLSSKNPIDNKENKSLKTSFKQECGKKLSEGLVIEEQPLGLYGYSLSYIYPKTAYKDTSINCILSLGFLNLNYTRFKFLKGVYIDPFGIEFSRKLNSTYDYTYLMNANWRPSISKNIYIPRFPYLNLNVGITFNTLMLFYVGALTPSAGLNIPLGSQTCLQLNAHYGLVLPPKTAFEVYDETTQETYIDWDYYHSYSQRMKGLYFETKFLITPNKKSNHSLKDRKIKI